MPKYRIHLANGKSLVLEGDTPPSDQDIEAAADSAGVRTLLMTSGERSLDSANSSPSTPSVGPLNVIAADAARRGVIRVGEEIATAPAVGKVVKAASGQAAQMAARAAGSLGGVPGYLAGETAAQVMRSPAATRTAEGVARAGGAGLARVAGSGLATALTSPLATVATMPFTEAGGRPVGETAETTAARQSDFAQQFKDMVNRQAGREVITGNTTDEIIASIARYRASK